ncbi:MAG TPA: hypothetical protein PKM88_00130 [bacterium]|nr:hypothetical protein [bacterium]
MPRFVVLALLWVAVVGLLVIGRYPQPIARQEAQIADAAQRGDTVAVYRLGSDYLARNAALPGAAAVRAALAGAATDTAAVQP